MRKKNMIVGISSVAFGIWMYYIAAQLRSGPDFWPKIVASGIIILGAIILSSEFTEKKSTDNSKDSKGDIKEYLNVIAVVVLLLLYYVSMQIVGYTIPTFLLITCTTYILGYRNLKVTCIVAFVITLTLYLSFTHLFGINFPGVFF